MRREAAVQDGVEACGAGGGLFGGGLVSSHEASLCQGGSPSNQPFAKRVRARFISQVADYFECVRPQGSGLQRVDRSRLTNKRQRIRCLRLKGAAKEPWTDRSNVAGFYGCGDFG